NPATWRNWYSAYGAKVMQEIKQGDQWAVLGNS
ncbi:MAG: hypothetical protein JWO91_2741, partial [Acidobacteriaceae bacterium]|nr:hypothetical protein [Acidobacteriaceae bacterium]